MKIKFTKATVICVGILLIMELMLNSVYALSYNFTVTADKTKVKAGEEVVVTMTISDIDMGDLGINAIESVLDYDDTVLEVVTRDDITMQNNWTMTYNQEAGAHEGNFLASNIVSGIKTTQNIGQITFKIREDAKPGTTVIKFKDVTSNDGATLVDEGDKTVTIEIIEDDGTASPTPVTTSTPKSSSSNTSSSGTRETLPQTGLNYSAVIIGIVAFSVIGIVAFIKYKRTVIK